jgi:hypothetical protein
MELNPCSTYHSVYPKCQQGNYQKLFNIPLNPQNQYFIQNQWDQSKCLGTQVICFDTTYGALTPCAVHPNHPGTDSLRSQAMYNGQLRQIIASRPQTKAWKLPCGGKNGRCTKGAPTAHGSYIRPWSTEDQ